MPIIPRYQPRGGPRTEALSYAGAYDPPGGADWRRLGQAAEAAGRVVQLAQGLSRGRPEPSQDNASPRGGHASSRVPPPRTLDPSAAMAATEKEVAWREAQLALDDAGDEMDAEVVAQSRRQMAESLSGPARELFDLVTRPREAGFVLQAAARAERGAAGRREALALRREQLGVEEYVRQADIDEGLGRMALASAVAQRGERLAAAGHGPEAVRAGKQDLLAMAETVRIQRAIAADPGKAAGLLAMRGEVLAQAERDALAREIEVEQARVEAGAVVGRLAGGVRDLAGNLEGLMAEVDTVAGEDADRRAAYRSAALGAWRGARARREAVEDAGWQAVAPLLDPRAGVGSWTDVPGPVWAALSGRQREAVMGWFDDPGRVSDPGVLNRLADLVRDDPVAFGQVDLASLGTSLSWQDYSGLRGLQLTARQGGADWARAREAWLTDSGAGPA